MRNSNKIVNILGKRTKETRAEIIAQRINPLKNKITLTVNRNKLLRLHTDFMSYPKGKMLQNIPHKKSLSPFLLSFPCF